MRAWKSCKFHYMAETVMEGKRYFMESYDELYNKRTC